MENKRIEWIDIVKLLGIIAIFCGHMGIDAGNIYYFVFKYHVPLFFFVSGIFAVRLECLSLKEAVKKRFEQIIIPYTFVVMLTMVMIVVTNESGFLTYLKYLKEFIWGIRNQTYAASLWFFSCLFCMSVLFEVLRRLLKYKSLLFLAVIGVHVLSITIFPNRPDGQPSWIFNIDSACFYLMYYAFGYFSSKVLQKENGNTVIHGCGRKFASLVGIAVLTCYTVLVYIGADARIVEKTVYPILPMAGEIYPIIRALLMILFNLVLAQLLAGFEQLAKIGSQTFWLCGNEFIVKTIFNAAASIFGLQIAITGSLEAVIYAVAMTVFIIKVLMPIEMKLYRRYIDCVAKFWPSIVEQNMRHMA